MILSDHLNPSTSRVLSAQLFARVLKADALDSTFLISLSTSSKSLPFTAFSSLDTGAREDWDGLIGRTTPADSDESFLLPSPIPEGKKSTKRRLMDCPRINLKLQFEAKSCNQSLVISLVFTSDARITDVSTTPNDTCRCSNLLLIEVFCSVNRELKQAIF